MTFFYDFNIKPDLEIITTLEKFNFTGACIFYNSREFNENTLESFNDLNNSCNLKLYCGVYIDEKNSQLMRKQVQRFDKKADLIMVYGGDNKLNRSIAELPRVDIINKPYNNRKNSGINHVLAKMLVENNITVNINIKDILSNHGYFRSKILNQINQLLSLQEKFKFRVIISSGGENFYDVRSPEGIILLSQLMNMDKNYAQECISGNVCEVISNIKKRKDSIVEGIRIIR